MDGTAPLPIHAAQCVCKPLRNIYLLIIINTTGLVSFVGWLAQGSADGGMAAALNVVEHTRVSGENGDVFLRQSVTQNVAGYSSGCGYYRVQISSFVSRVVMCQEPR